MSAILMIEVTDATGDIWNLNLDYIAGVEIPAPGPVTSATKITNEMVHMHDGVVIQLAPGTWHASIASLIADFNMGTRKAEDYLYIGGAP